MKRVFDIKENEFTLNVTNSLKAVSENLCKCEKRSWPGQHPVDQLSSNYFVVNVNDVIDPVLLDFYLREELAKRSVDTDFEYGIYDCSSENMVFTRYIDFDGTASPEMAKADFPSLKANDYYFGILFPHKLSNIIGGMGIWVYSSVVLLVVIIFFAYTMFVILKQKRLSEIQKDFINNMTHEFKTPISTIAVSSEVLKDPGIIRTPERLLNYATIIQNESNRLKKQVERVLQMASLDKSDIGLKKEEVDIHELVNNAITTVKPLLDEKDGNIECSLNARDSTLKADKLHLTNIIYNLLDNAIKYCKNVPSIGLFTENERNGIKIGVSDNGIGITSDNQKKIFHKFFRVPTGNLHDVKGFGLGLNYVNIITRAHNGDVKVTSSPGSGSTFSIYIPFE